MAVSYTNQKYNTVTRLQTICVDILEQINEAMQLRQEALDNAFQPGGANGITDNELNGTGAPFPHLATGDLTAAFAAIAAIDTTLAATSRTHYKALEKMRP